MDELSEDDKLIVSRGKRLQLYLSQPFQVAETFSGKAGEMVEMESAVEDVKGIVEGKYDDIPESSFGMSGDMSKILLSARKVAEDQKKRLDEEKAELDAQKGDEDIVCVLNSSFIINFVMDCSPTHDLFFFSYAVLSHLKTNKKYGKGIVSTAIKNAPRNNGLGSKGMLHVLFNFKICSILPMSSAFERLSAIQHSWRKVCLASSARLHVLQLSFSFERHSLRISR